MAFPILIIKSNVSQVTPVLIRDMGIKIPSGGLSETLNTFSAVLKAQKSRRLIAFANDNAHGAGQHTLILNDGTADIAPGDIEAFLASLLLSDAGNYSAVQRNGSGQVAQSIAFDGVATVSSLKAGSAIDAGGFQINNIAAATLNSDVPTYGQVLGLVGTGKAFKEIILSADQLDSVNNSISQAIPLYFSAVLADGDFITLTDGTASETYTAKAVPSLANDFLIGATANESMANFAAKVLANSAVWSAVSESSLSKINPTGSVVVIERKAQLVNSYIDRVFGTIATPSQVQVVDLGGEIDYIKDASIDLPAADTTAKMFGFGRATASIITNETHLVRTTDQQFTWDSDALVWQNTGSGAITASNGLQKVGSDLQPVYGAPASIGSANVSGTALSLSHSDHVHAHGDQSATAGTVHNSAGITVAGAYTGIGSPTDVEGALSNINGLFAGAAKSGKTYVYGVEDNVEAGGTAYLVGPGEVETSLVPPQFDIAGKIVGVSIKLDENVAAGKAYKLSVEKNGLEVYSLAIGAGTGIVSLRDMALSIPTLVTDEWRYSIVETTTSGTDSVFSAGVLTVWHVPN